MQKTVVFDFDGVIHSYTSGWVSIAEIPDPVVPGIKTAIKDIREHGYRVVVVSSRCSNPMGYTAVKKYLKDNDIEVDEIMAEKPAAICYIDDRALKFDGNAYDLLDKVLNFETWIEKLKTSKLNCKVLDENVLKCAIIAFGDEHQKLKAIEEFSELTKEICKDVGEKGNRENLLEEFVDAQIMMDQLKMMYKFTDDELKSMRNRKISRLNRRLIGNEDE